jgi:heat-inducible transcriptional repressor
VPLRDGKLIAILVTTDGTIENRLIVDDVDPRRLESIHNYLNQLLKGMTLDEVRERVIRELGEDKNRYDEAVSTALRLGHAIFVARERSAEVVISGQANLLDDTMPKDDARELLRTLEDKETLIRLLDRTRHAEGLQVFLGAETALSSLASSSVIAMSYGAEERPIGAIAVIGPMRMNYGKVMSVVDVTADTVSQLLAELGSS